MVLQKNENYYSVNDIIIEAQEIQFYYRVFRRVNCL